jgi:hypothetical protein
LSQRGLGEERRGQGEGGEMAQIYANMNKLIKINKNLKKENDNKHFYTPLKFLMHFQPQFSVFFCATALGNRYDY